MARDPPVPALAPWVLTESHVTTMPPASGSLPDASLRELLSARSQWLRSAAPADVATVVGDATPPGTNLPLIEPIWSFWLDVARLAEMTTAFGARQITGPARSSARRIPKLNLPSEVMALLKAWLNDHGDGQRASAREANYLAHYGLRVPSGRGGVKPSPLLEAFHDVLVEAFDDETGLTRATPDATHLVLQLRRVHLALSRSASRIVDGLPSTEVFARLGESLALGRADLLTAQWLLARPEIVAGLRGHILVPYPEPWMPPLDRLRQLTRTIDSLSIFYYDLASTAEALLLSIRFGDWTQATPEAGTNWATFWHSEIARYLVAYGEVTGVDLTDE